MFKKIQVLTLCAAMMTICSSPAAAVEFKGSGEWLWGFGGLESSLMKDHKGGNDVFDARQRLRLQLEAIVSESLSGTLLIQVGDIAWGKAEDGGALGADGTIVKVRDAFIDWQVPSTDLRLRMGLQGFVLPNTAGGSSILDEQAAGIVASYKFSEAVGLTAFWLRPFNDNYVGFSGLARDKGQQSYYLDNVDYAGVSLPLTFSGLTITPWAMMGFMGRNALDAYSADPATDGEALAGPIAFYTMPLSYSGGAVQDGSFKARRAYASQFYAGLPLAITAFDPINIELDINYGYAQGFGKYSFTDRLGAEHRADSQRQGWLAKALVEYKMDWGTLGLLGWYASGDDGNARNGSERMPAIAPSANFTSFIQDGENGWSLDGGYDRMMTYAGTWGIGVQLKDISFFEDLNHVLRVVYWGGTNSPAMIKYSTSPQSWGNDTGLYLTTQDHLVEINADSTYKIYENLQATLELGYVVNGMDRDAWRKHSAEKSWQNADAWKAAVIIKYEF